MFRIYNLNILPHNHCCRVSDEQEPLSCSLLHPRLLMCQIPGIMKWQCTHQIMLENNRDFPRPLTDPSVQIQADPSFVEPKIWLFWKLKLIQELLQEFFSFITNRTNHRANDNAAGNCTFDIKILLWFNMYQWGSLCLLPASNSREMEISVLISLAQLHVPNPFCPPEIWGSVGSTEIRDYQKGVRA